MLRSLRISFYTALCFSTSTLIDVASPLSPPVTLVVSDLIPLASWQKRFQIIEGKDRGKIVPIIFHHDPVDEQRWKLVLGNYGSVLMRSDSSGALMMERLDLFKSRSYILYEPALPILPGKRTPALATKRQGNFKMYDVETGRLKRAGHVTHAVKQISASQFNTPAGLIDGHYIDIEHGMDMPLASLHFTLRLGCGLDEGPVYGSGRYTLRKLGLFSDTKTAAAALEKH
jgi:hypothetical protein